VTQVFNLAEIEVSGHGMATAPPGHEFSGASLTDDVGAQTTGVGIYVLPPGQASWPYHFELAEEEWALVIDGEVTLRTPSGNQTLRRGDLVCFPAGADGAHSFRNDGDSPARFAMLSAGLTHIDGCVYPDSGKIVVRGRGFSRRFDLGEEREYWEGES
jgi:uncharacterized cupin superfamily protein